MITSNCVGKSSTLIIEDKRQNVLDSPTLTHTNIEKEGENMEVLPRIIGYGFWIIMFLRIVISILPINCHSKSDTERIRHGGVPYIKKRLPNGDWYEYEEGERDPHKPYTDAELAAMPVSERIAIKRPNRAIRNLSANECRCCGGGSVVSTYGFCRGVLCSRCADKYMASDLCGQNLESYGIVGKAKLYLWIEQRRLAMDVQEGLLTEEEAEIEAKNIFNHAIKSCARQKQNEEEYARHQEELKNKEQELADIANRLF